MYIVTGVSRGLGKAIVQELLLQNEKVIGIGRKSDFEHPNFQFYPCDLKSAEEIESLSFKVFKEPVTLINNAGIIGEINRISAKKQNDFAEVLQVNTIAPFELMKKVYNQMENKNLFTLVNISSGAANRSIPSWASYCASKSALNMITENFYLEEKELGFSPQVYAVSPGVIDTDMQKEIRSSEPDNFSSLENFVELKQKNALFSPEEASKRLFILLKQEYKNHVFFDLRDLKL